VASAILKVQHLQRSFLGQIHIQMFTLSSIATSAKLLGPAKIYVTAFSVNCMEHISN
jgi:hypothetical protein